MKLLLDTHIWLWSLGESKRLTTRVARELANPENQLWLSPVSVWELHLLHRKKRIDLNGADIESWVRSSFEMLQLTEATFTIDVALEVSKLNFPHGDPGDRFLVASAKVFGLTLVTADEQIIHSADIPILPNR